MNIIVKCKKITVTVENKGEIVMQTIERGIDMSLNLDQLIEMVEQLKTFETKAS